MPLPLERVRELAPKGIILSGGPASVYEKNAPRCDPGIFELDVPVLGICYGMQLACDVLGGRVESAPAREFGRAHCSIISHADLFDGTPFPWNLKAGANGVQLAEAGLKSWAERRWVDVPAL